MSDTVVIHAEGAFEEKRRENEVHRMAQFYLVFKPQLEHYLVLSKCSFEQKKSFERECKLIYDGVVRKMVEDKKIPHEDDFVEFLSLFKEKIISNPLFTSIISLDIVQLLQHSHDSL